jgi:wyosine [tRNA(Phe)-imidazoG37] synthetase (radical SAM superfamily)
MSGFLFHETIYGPVYSRRLGVSLGVNLMPTHAKHCTFNCIYCECGWNSSDKEQPKIPSRREVSQLLDEKLSTMKHKGTVADTITFAGNGEPTLHPDFNAIIDDTIALRDQYFPLCKISVLSNTTMLHKAEVVTALKKIDQNILKLDAGTEEMFQLINQPGGKITLRNVVDEIKQFGKNLIVQTMFLRGEYNGRKIDNTTDTEIEAWIKLIVEINPPLLMIYPVDRETPVSNIEKIPEKELEAIAAKVSNLGIQINVYG